MRLVTAESKGDKALDLAQECVSIPGLMSIVREAVQITYLSSAYSEIAKYPLPLHTPLGQLSLQEVYTALDAVSLEKAMPSFEETCRQEGRLEITSRLSVERAYGYSNLFNAHRSRLLDAYKAISQKFDLLKANVGNHIQKQAIEEVHDLFLSETLEKKFPFIFEEIGSQLLIDLSKIYQRFEERFSGAQGIYQSLINLIEKKISPLERESDKKWLLSQAYAISRAANFLWWYSKNIRHYSRAHKISFFLGGPVRMTSQFSKLNLKAELLIELLISSLNLQECFDFIVAEAEAEIEGYRQSSFSDFESRDLKSSRDIIMRHIRKLELLCQLLKQDGENKERVSQLENILKKLNVIFKLLLFYSEIAHSLRKISKQYSNTQSSCAIEFIEGLNSDIRVFSKSLEKFFRLLQVREECFPMQGFCREIFAEISDTSQTLQTLLSKAKNNSFQDLISSIEAELKSIELEKKWYLRFDDNSPNLFYPRAYRGLLYKIEGVRIRVEQGLELYSSEEMFPVFWFREGVKGSLVATQDRIFSEERVLKDTLRRDTITFLSMLDFEASNVQKKSVFVLDNLEKALEFLLDLMINAKISKSLARSSWWRTHFLSALKKREAVLEQEIDDYILTLKPLDKLLITFLSPGNSSDEEGSHRPVFCAEVAENLQNYIDLIKKFIKISRILNEIKISEIKTESWSELKLSLENLKLQYESFGKIPPIEAGLNLIPLANFIIQRNRAIFFARQEFESIDPEITLILKFKHAEANKSFAKEMLSNIQKAIQDLNNNFEEFSDDLKSRVGLMALSREQQAYFVEVYFPMQENLRSKYYENLSAVEERVLDCLGDEEENTSQMIKGV